MIFQESVESAFGFLESEYGFSKLSASDSQVAYESTSVVINIIYDFQRSYEASVVLSLKTKSDQIPFSIGDLVQIKNLNQFKDLIFYQSSKLEHVNGYLIRVALVLQKYFSSLLKGDATEFARLDEYRSLKADEYTNKKRISLLRVRANQAWEEKEYSSFLIIISALEDSCLTTLDRKRISFAQKKIG